MLTFAETLFRAARAFSRDRCSLLAAGITYFALVSLVPLTLFAVGIAGFLFQSEADQQRVVDEITGALPISQGNEDLRSLISNAVEARKALGVVGLLGTGWAGSALFGAVRSALVSVYQNEKRRPYVKAKLVDIASVLAFAALLLLSLGLTFLVALAQNHSEKLLGDELATLTSSLLSFAYVTAPAAFSFLVFFLLYTLVPAAGMGHRNAAWGALVASVLFEGLKVGFAQYVAHFGNYDATYGTIGFVIALLAFFYFGAQVMLLGAEFTRERRWVLLSPPAERTKNLREFRAKIRGAFRKLRRRTPEAVELPEPQQLTTPPTVAMVPMPASAPENTSPVDLEEQAPQHPRGGGFGWFFGGLVLGLAAAAAIRRKGPEDKTMV